MGFSQELSNYYTDSNTSSQLATILQATFSIFQNHRKLEGTADLSSKLGQNSKFNRRL